MILIDIEMPGKCEDCPLRNKRIEVREDGKVKSDYECIVTRTKPEPGNCPLNEL